MEAFLLVGCLLSVPLIYYITRPYTPPKAYKPHSDMDEEKEPEMDPVQLQNASEQARKRQERVLSTLTPKERELLKDYLDSLRDPVKRKELGKMQRLDCLMGTVVTAALLGGVYLLATHW